LLKDYTKDSTKTVYNYPISNFPKVDFKLPET